MIINGMRIMTLIANQAEYGEHMQMLSLNPDFIGIGPIEAAMNVTRLLQQTVLENKKPDVIFSVGTAGSKKLPQCGLYQINKVSYRDMDASAFGFDKGKTPFTTYPAVFDLPVLFDNLPVATLSTGAKVISHDEFDSIDADCVDMETYAVKRIADFYHIPVVALRGISDGATPAEGAKTWTEYLHVIDVKIASFYENVKHDSSGLIRLISHYMPHLEDDSV